MLAERRSWMMSLPVAVVVWAAITSLAGFVGIWMGFGGRRFAVALGVAALLFAFEWFLAAPAAQQFVEKAAGGWGALISPLVPLCAVLVYSGAITANARWAFAGAAYAVLPALVLARSAGKQPGTWEDYTAAAVVWVPVQFHWIYQ